jgi:hypothetical protein
MFTGLLLIVIVVLQVISMFLIVKNNPNGIELKKIFDKQEKLTSNEANDNENSNSLDKDMQNNPISMPHSLDSDTKLSQDPSSPEMQSGSDSSLGPNTNPGSDSTHLNPETHPAPDTKPNAETHLNTDEDKKDSSSKQSQSLISGGNSLKNQIFLRSKILN